jgi:hypothetical protein
LTQHSSVDLPEPEGPSGTQKWPRGTTKLTPSSALVPSAKIFVTSWKANSTRSLAAAWSTRGVIG